MPIYEYECEICAYRFELKRRFDEDEGSPCCPQCQGKARQLFSAPFIIFKGSGFYVTDNRSDSGHSLKESKTDKVEGVKKEEAKTNKVEGTKKEEVNTNKVEGTQKEEVKANKIEGDKKEDGTTAKVQGSKKEESK